MCSSMKPALIQKKQKDKQGFKKKSTKKSGSVPPTLLFIKYLGPRSNSSDYILTAIPVFHSEPVHGSQEVGQIDRNCFRGQTLHS